MRELADCGCSHIAIVHDLDRARTRLCLNDAQALKERLSAIAVPNGVKCFVCIPTEEIEAWFWADEQIVKSVGRGRGSAPASPERLPKPKEAFIRLSRDAGGKPLYSKNDLPKLARKLNLAICEQRCPSFRRFADFLRAA
jgi:hypothetical protein